MMSMMGEFEDKEDEWGTTGGAALAAKKRAQRAAACEGRIYTVQVTHPATHACTACMYWCSCRPHLLRAGHAPMQQACHTAAFCTPQPCWVRHTAA
jgi:hypothetical protein